MQMTIDQARRPGLLLAFANRRNRGYMMRSERRSGYSSGGGGRRRPPRKRRPSFIYLFFTLLVSLILWPLGMVMLWRRKVRIQPGTKLLLSMMTLCISIFLIVFTLTVPVNNPDFTAFQDTANDMLDKAAARVAVAGDAAYRKGVRTWHVMEDYGDAALNYSVKHVADGIDKGVELGQDARVRLTEIFKRDTSETPAETTPAATQPGEAAITPPTAEASVEPEDEDALAIEDLPDVDELEEAEGTEAEADDVTEAPETVTHDALSLDVPEETPDPSTGTPLTSGTLSANGAFVEGVANEAPESEAAEASTEPEETPGALTTQSAEETAAVEDEGDSEAQEAADEATQSPEAIEESVEPTSEMTEEAAETTPEATGEAVEESADATPETSEEAVEVTPEATEEAAEATPEATEEAAEATPEATEEAVEATPEATEEAAEATPEATEEAVEATPKATEEAVEASPEATEAVEATPEATEEAVEATPEATEAVEAQPAMTVTVKPAGDATVYFYNGGKAYHRKGCKTIGEDAPQHTLAEAIEAGKRVCGSCNPLSTNIMEAEHVAWVDAGNVIHTTDECPRFTGEWTLISLESALANGGTPCPDCQADRYAASLNAPEAAEEQPGAEETATTEAPEASEAPELAATPEATVEPEATFEVIPEITATLAAPETTPEAVAPEESPALDPTDDSVAEPLLQDAAEETDEDADGAGALIADTWTSEEELAEQAADAAAGGTIALKPAADAMVYHTPNGKYYHRKSTCTNMSGATAFRFGESVQQGYKQCSNCSVPAPELADIPCVWMDGNGLCHTADTCAAFVGDWTLVPREDAMVRKLPGCLACGGDKYVASYSGR